jgi:hypothetical protein
LSLISVTPLYVIHGINGYILMRALAGFGVPPTLCIIFTAATAMSFAYLLHIAVELATHRLGRHWGHVLTPSRTHPSQLLKTPNMTDTGAAPITTDARSA